MTNLTDTQLVILNTAAGRESRAVLPLPKSLKINKGTATSVLKALLTKGLIEEHPANAGDPSWRQDVDGRPMALMIASTGLAALDAGPDGGKRAKPAKPASHTAKRPRIATKPSETSRPGGKVNAILTLLQRPDGARLKDLEKVTGWQPHSVRAALTGLRKRSIAVTRERKDDVTVYFAERA